MHTTLTVDEARAAYVESITTWKTALLQFKRSQITQSSLDAADSAVELAAAHYSAAIQALRPAA